MFQRTGAIAGRAVAGADRPRRRRFGLLAGLVLAALLTGYWAAGGFWDLDFVARTALRNVQNALARGLNAIRAGEAGALGGLLGICFAYGFLHAVGPGHGKMLIGGYGVARRVAAWPLVMVALSASLAQSLVAVLLVSGGVWLLGWGRTQLEWANATYVVPLGSLLIAGVGLWMLVRGSRRSWQIARHRAPPGQGAAIGHTSPGDDEDHSCGHAHGPAPADVAGLTGWRDTAMLIAGIGFRPCSGALVLLVLTQGMGIPAAGFAGTLAMGLGTASVTVLVALMAVWAREGALHRLPGSRLARILPLIEALAGAVIMVVALSLMQSVP